MSTARTQAPQVFLGGSCNPTTWRQNVAIPFLQSNHVSFYNPQVDNWTQEVVSVERHAKQTARYLLFVIDKQTRSTVGLVESAFLAGDNRSLVLVVYPFDVTKEYSGQLSPVSISGDVISNAELTELGRARHLLESLVILRQIPIFTDIQEALRHIVANLHESKGLDKVEPYDIKPQQVDQITDVCLFSNQAEEALPLLLEAKGLSFTRVPDDVEALKMSVIDRSRVTLFVVTNCCRGLSMMILASYLMPRFRKTMVLCVQYLDDQCSIGQERLTKNAVADYNRGRVYLCDYAIALGVPVFETISEAVDCCQKKTDLIKHELTERETAL